MSAELENREPSRAEIDAMTAPLILEFGSIHCGHCQAAQPHIAAALAGRTGFRHLRIEDGKGRRLGRSFTVKLWPTLIFIDCGKEIARLVRPDVTADISGALDALLGSDDAR